MHTCMLMQYGVLNNIIYLSVYDGLNVVATSLDQEYNYYNCPLSFSMTLSALE